MSKKADIKNQVGDPVAPEVAPESIVEPVLYHIHTTQDEVMVRATPSMLDLGNVIDIIKESAGEKENHPISKEYAGWGKIQNENQWIYLKYTKRVAV